MSATLPFDHDQFKATTRDQWNLVASGWNDQSPHMRTWLGSATRIMLERAGFRSGSRVLDVAAGAGDQTLDIAQRVGPEGSVLATDLSPAILEFAAENARRAGFTNVTTKVLDGEHLGLDESTFDAAVCRLGLMLFPDPLSGLREIYRALVPGGKASVMVFGEPSKNPCVGIAVTTALKHAGLPPRDPYQAGGLLSLGKPGAIADLFMQAGFGSVETIRLQAVFRLQSTREYVEFLRTSAGPIVQILARLNAAGRKTAWAEIEAKLGTFQTSAGWEGPNEVLVTVGTR